MQILNDDVKIMHDELMKDRSEGNMSLGSGYFNDKFLNEKYEQKYKLGCRFLSNKVKFDY